MCKLFKFLFKTLLFAGAIYGIYTAIMYLSDKQNRYISIYNDEDELELEGDF